MIENDMKELRQGNISALTNIYNETVKAVFSICYSMMQNYSSAEDMMQDTFIKVRKYIFHYELGTNAKAWIFSIAKNTCLNEIKKQKREILTDFSERTDFKDEKQSDICAQDEMGIFAIVKKNLNENESKLVLMHTLGDMTFKEIAKTLEKSEGTIRWQYMNALNKLRKIINKEELFNEKQ